jgi:hypothetical protein
MSGFLTRVGATAALVGLSLASSAGATLRVHWFPGVRSPGTPARYDKVGVLKIGRSQAHNVLVLEPGTEAGSAYFVPLAHTVAQRGR